MEAWPETIFQKIRNNICIATTDDEVLKIGKLRFALHSDRARELHQHADYRRLTLIEPVDKESLNFYAADRSSIRAAVRLSRASDTLSDPLLAPMAARLTARSLKQTVVCSRLVVEPTIAARKAIVPLFQEVYRASLNAGATKCLLSTSANLSEIFVRFGFKESGISFVDTVAGQLNVSELELYDYEYLMAISSPLIDVASEQFSPSICPQLKQALQSLCAPVA